MSGRRRISKEAVIAWALLAAGLLGGFVIDQIMVYRGLFSQ
jgi:hypothetical protein